MPNPVAYRIETERLVIRCYAPSDAAAMRATLDRGSEHLHPWIPWMKDEPRTRAQTGEWLRQRRSDFDLDKNYCYGIFDAQERELIGETGLYTRAGPNAREIGYLVARGFEGKGFASEAAAAMTRVAFENDGMDRVEIHCGSANTASARIPEKLGFTHETTLSRRGLGTDDSIFDLMLWRLFAADYEGSPASELRLTAFDCTGARLLG
jgi:RimJ/RimL family protein N-acetyltransferase